MNIILNNRPETFSQSELTINELLQEKNFSFKMLVIKVNGILVKKGQYDSHIVKDGDDVTVLHLVSGG
ncbi:MAG TPA: sulfur carrier protein ThiS [Bacteroidales bacterium]|nr:sulfur carrier protein ThiS [Bacteroidales bacterium]